MDTPRGMGAMGLQESQKGTPVVLAFMEDLQDQGGTQTLEEALLEQQTPPTVDIVRMTSMK